jgi:hypothetical protein
MKTKHVSGIKIMTEVYIAGDTGLCLLAEHCHRLKSLNLCETLVTDEGLLVSAFLSPYILHPSNNI